MSSPLPPPASIQDLTTEGDLPAASPTMPEHVVEPPARAATKQPNRIIIVAGAAAAVLLLGVGIAIGWAIGSSGDGSANDTAPPPESPFPAAKKKCAPGSDHADLGDEGKSLTLAGQGEKSLGLPYPVIACFLTEVKTPDAVIAHMDSTRALDGRQTAEWGDIEASWTYHPNSGLKVILTFSDSAAEK